MQFAKLLPACATTAATQNIKNFSRQSLRAVLIEFYIRRRLIAAPSEHPIDGRAGARLAVGESRHLDNLHNERMSILWGLSKTHR